MAGLAERSGPFAAVAAAARRLPASVRLSLSLGDERVIVARKPAPAGRSKPASEAATSANARALSADV